MRFSNLLRGLAFCLAPLAVSVYAADYVAVAHIIYDGNTLYYADNESSLKYKKIEKNEDETFTIKFTEERLADGKKDVRKLRLGVGCSESSCTKNFSEGSEPLLGELFPDYKDDVDDQPIYEIWIVINDDKTITTSSTKPTITPKLKKVIRFFAPWTNTNAKLFVNGSDEGFMTNVPNYCGWYETKIVPPEDDSLSVYFMQTIGGTYVGNEGATKDPIDIEHEISLDSIAAISDTIWVYGYQFGAPDITKEYPGVSGDCPIKVMPVMMFDWYDGSVNSDGSEDGLYNRKKGAGRTGFDSRGVPMFGSGVNEDFGQGGCEGDPMTGMVEKELGENGLPVRAADFPSDCKNSTHIDSWFLPEVIGEDAAGNKYDNVTCRELELSLDDEGYWYAQIDDSSPEGGLFLLDDFRWLDSAKTVENPHYDSLPGLEVKGVRGYHNFGFAMKIQATFQYIPGQYFEFNGDDDVWVFINNRLVVDIGGQHGQASGAVNLDTIGQNDVTQKLIPGQTYPFHIFYAERHQYESNFKMETSIDLKTEASLLLDDNSKDATHLEYGIRQIVREQQLSCDFSSSMQATDTTRAPSNFNLIGGNLPAEGVYLDPTQVWFGGITINEDMTGFQVNVDDIKAARALTPGLYCMRFTLQSDPTQGDEVWFEVDSYALPTIVYANKGGEILGSMVNNQVTPIGEWAYQKYQVNVQYEEDWATYDDVLFINATDTLLTVVDENNIPINSVTLNQGKANFYIIAKGDVIGATLMVKGAASSNTAAWVNIDLKIPPVPLVDYAIMYDRDGDGRADSLYVKYTKSLVSKSKIDSLQFTFGETFPVSTQYTKAGDSALVITADGGFSSAVFTGLPDTLYNGVMQTWFTYSDEGGKSTFPVTGDIIDRVNPIITSAEVDITDHNTNLIITFSEGIADSSRDYYLDMFMYKCWRAGSTKDPINPISVKISKPNIWKLPFNGGLNDVVPAVGDSIRLVPGQAPLYLGSGNIAYDLSATAPHVNNPWVRITGDQEVQVTSAPVASIDPSNDKTVEIVTSKEPTVPKLITDMTMDVEDVVEEYGTQGHLIGFDMAQLAANENAAIVADIDKGKLTVDVLLAIERGDISVKKAKKQYDLSDATVDAIKDNSLRSSNIAGVKNGTVKIVSKDNISIHYKTSYFTSLGHYVNGESGEIACSDTIYNGDCLNNGGNLFLAWNMRATDNRLVATGVYIARLEIKVKAGSKTISDMTRDMLWGVRRGKVNALDLESILREGVSNNKKKR